MEVDDARANILRAQQASSQRGRFASLHSYAERPLQMRQHPVGKRQHAPAARVRAGTEASRLGLDMSDVAAELERVAAGIQTRSTSNK